MSDPFRCSTASRSRGDHLAGTATNVHRFLLVEHAGPWGVDALRDAPMDDRLRTALQVRGTRTLFIRRHGARPRDAGEPRVLAAARRSLTGTTVPDLTALLDVDLADPGWPAVDGPFFGVCTHGRHDACCAERGRPIAAALHALDPEHTWEISHMGGDRFAGNVLVLPTGLYYGHVDAESVADIHEAHLAGRLELSHLRGRTALPMAAQYAELELRRRLDLDRIDAVRFLGHRGDAWHFDVGGDQHLIWVEQTFSEPAALTCRAPTPSPVPHFRVVAHHTE